MSIRTKQMRNWRYFVIECDFLTHLIRLYVVPSFQRTLDGWLKLQEQNVTVRSRPKSAKDVEDMKYMSTMTMQESKQTMLSEDKDPTIDGMDEGDGDISDLQCMLANALLE